MLYELYEATRKGEGWVAASGAVFNLRSEALRPEGWTSADAAGLPIFPLLARYPEVSSGQIDHALRVTVPSTQNGYIHPATHFASSSSNPNLPPMGLRLRLKASYSLAGFSGESLVILEALKRYGLIVADNGSPWFITGAPNPPGTTKTSKRSSACPARNSKPSKAARSCTAEPRRSCALLAPAEPVQSLGLLGGLRRRRLDCLRGRCGAGAAARGGDGCLRGDGAAAVRAAGPGCSA